MNKFDNTYNKILNNIIQTPCEFSINEINECIKQKYKWFGISEILNEYVEEKTTTPIPKDFFINICKNIKTKEFQILHYSFKEISSLLDNYNYENIEEFKNNLNNGNLYIISSKQISDNLTNDEMIKIYNLLLNTFNEDEIEKIIYECGKNVKGVTSSLKIIDDINSYNNIFIFLNQNKIVKRSWTTTLEHEITHFIQRIIGHEKSLKRSVEIPGNGYGLYLKHKNILDKIFNIDGDNRPNNEILEFIKYIIKPVEQDTSFKHICMQFQREYERNNKEITSHKNDSRLIKNFKQREQWINNFLDKISNHNYFNSLQWKNNLNLIKNNFEDLSLNEKIKYDLIHAIIGFLIYDNILPEKNIKEKIINHFKSFKYRDN